MNAVERDKSGKNCLIFFRNKKINNFDAIDEIIDVCASHGYYYDKVACVAYDSSYEITNALTAALENYSNIVLCCPKVMENTLKDFVVHGTDGAFSELNIFANGGLNVFMLFSDSANRLQINDICSVLDKKYGIKYDKAYIKTVGAPGAVIKSAIAKIKSACESIDINVKESYGDCTIELVYDSTTPKTQFDLAMREAVKLLNNYVYALDDVKLEERLFQLLKLRRMKISVAESFTGGGVGKRLVDVPGISEVYFEGLNTYSNEAKSSRLGVKEETLAKYGAVSKETAAQMAEGLIAGGNCSVSVSTTGIAGPKSDNTKKPVGLLYIAVADKDETQVYEYNLKGTRENIT
ncbi:MAG: nicotinamide-nucleotide amidohydrolase family protein, partial [Clostridia bacterium]|nr:nicotinamide-nucleotide amidohydrolase family protein [Clostridia bacterium]